MVVASHFLLDKGQVILGDNWESKINKHSSTRDITLCINAVGHAANQTTEVKQLLHVVYLQFEYNYRKSCVCVTNFTCIHFQNQVHAAGLLFSLSSRCVSKHFFLQCICLLLNYEFEDRY